MGNVALQKGFATLETPFFSPWKCVVTATSTIYRWRNFKRGIALLLTKHVTNREEHLSWLHLKASANYCPFYSQPPKEQVLLDSPRKHVLLFSPYNPIANIKWIWYRDRAFRYQLLKNFLKSRCWMKDRVKLIMPWRRLPHGLSK